MNDERNADDPRTDRRDFLKTSGVAAGTALAANLGLLSNVHAAGSDEIRVGLIGCGGRGTGAADNVLHAAPNVKLVAIGDVFKYRTEGCRRTLLNLNKKADIQQLGNSVDLPEERCYTGLDCHERVINTPGVNYVILATPPGFRPVHLQAAVAAGKNVFTEKPVSVDGPGTRKVLAAYEEALKKKLAIAAGTQRRHETSYLETMKKIHDGAIGDITAMRCYWNGSGIWFRDRSDLAKKGEKATDLAYQLNNWYHFVWTCGDHICEQHVHNLDVCNWAMGNKHPIRAVGMGARSARKVGDPNEVGHIFDFFAIDFEYENGVHMLSMCRQIADCVSRVGEDLVGTKGVCVPGSTINREKVLGANRKNNSPYVQEHTDLIQSIRNGTPINELKNVAESSLTAVMGRMSAYTGKAVSWEQALNSKEDTMPPRLDWDMKLTVAPVAVPGKTPLL